MYMYMVCVCYEILVLCKYLLKQMYVCMYVKYSYCHLKFRLNALLIGCILYKYLHNYTYIYTAADKVIVPPHSYCYIKILDKKFSIYFYCFFL